MLGSHKTHRGFPACQPRGQSVGIPAYLLIHSGWQEVTCETYYRSALSEEVLRTAVPYRKHIIIEIKVLFVQSRNPVQEHFDCSTVECRKVFLRNYVLMEDDPEIGNIYPLRYLRRMRDDKIYVSYERHINFYASEDIFQCSPIPVKAFLL